MKTKLLGISLFLFTATLVAFYPWLRGAATTTILSRQGTSTQGPAAVEVVFVLDTTGSMSGLIETAKEKVWSIATTMAQADQAPTISMGLVAYRDRGDDYVTQVIDLSTDLDSMYAALMDFSADGGGDGPESVNRALDDAIHSISWSQNPSSYKVVFLVGDAPPHMDYQGETRYPEIAAAAVARGIVINTIQCGEVQQTVQPWKQIALLGKGAYFQVEQAGGAFAVATPFDEDIALLSAELDQTRLYYGSTEEREEKEVKVAATQKLHELSSLASRARRAVFNTSAAGVANLFGERELVEDIQSGRIDLDDIAAEELPETLRAMAPAEQQAAIARTATERTSLRQRIDGLAAQRDNFIAGKVEEAGGADDSLDQKIYELVRDQAAPKGLDYASGPKF